MAHTQDNRLSAVATPLGKDVLLLESLSGTEGVSELFRFDLRLLAEVDRTIDFDAIVGKNVTVRMFTPGGDRFLNGLISRFSEGSSDETFTTYHAELVPWLWMLTQTADCRIFQQKTAPEIIQQIFGDLGFTDFTLQLSRSYPVRDYCVQYRETDFNFVTRLMEQYGIFYYFEHTNGAHRLILDDVSPGAPPCPTQPRARFHRGAGTLTDHVVTGWRRGQSVRPGKYALTDYNFETPSVSLAVNVASQTGMPKLEIYDYPGEYQKRADGEMLVRTRIEEEDCQHKLFTGTSTCVGFTSGYRFELAEHPRSSQNGTYLLTRVTHRAQEPGYRSQTGEFSYDNTFTCIPESVTYRPPRRTPRPVVEGVQTAVVVTVGEDIFTDKYGRVKVQFHWDREHQRNEESSCWIRVSQPWAGKNWGAIFLPRLGQEVVVDFLEGDPDQPIIVGRVYNAEQMPPYELPANQTQSGVKSRSAMGGGPSNFNELRFEDKKGSEQVYLHAEKTLTTVVEESESHSVGGSRSTTIGKDDTLVVQKGNRTATIEEGDDKLTIVKGKRETTIKGNDTLTIQDGDHVVNVLKGKNVVTASKGNVEFSAPVGKYSISANQVAITGTTDITLSCGGSSIKMTPGSITITAPIVKINC